MPVYCYIAQDGSRFERSFPLGRAPESITIIARRDFVSEQKGVPSKKGWPIECIASGVNAADANELRAFLSRAGVPTEVTPDGNPLYRDLRHQRKALKVRGFVDRSSYL